MKSKNSKITGIAVILIAGFLFSSCNRLEVIDGFAQGTTYHIVYDNKTVKAMPHRVHISKYQVDSILSDFDMSLSTYQKNSIISRININEPGVRPDKKFIEVLELSRGVWEASEGAFDLTVGPLVNAWGFGADGVKEYTDSSVIDSLLQLVGMDKISLEDGLLIKEDSRLRLDVNAVAQGYSVDVLAGFFESQGIGNYLIEVGGELRASGNKPGNKPWRVGIDKPYEHNLSPGTDLQEILQLKDISLATSGNYRKFYEKDGVKYSHSINPATGYPVMDRLLSATIVCESCALADAFATACMVSGLEKGLDMLKADPRLEGYFVYSGDKGEFLVKYTEGFKRFIEEEE